MTSVGSDFWLPETIVSPIYEKRLRASAEAYGLAVRGSFICMA